MSNEAEERMSELATLGVAQLRAISQDPRHAKDVRAAARKLIEQISAADLRSAVESFEAATPVFTDLTNRLVSLTTKARTTPGGDAVATLTPIVRQFGEELSKITGEPGEVLPQAGSQEAQEDDPSPPVQAPQAMRAPAPGTVSTSRSLSQIAGEYVAMFDAALIDPARSAAVDRLATLLVSFRPNYALLEADLGIPWYFVGLIHCMESNFNFGTHLHNGDSLMHRTVNVPKGRPTPQVADPPFAWTTSATDALTMAGFHTQTSWTLAAQLFRLEKYNGVGYRMRGRASPYLWSFSDRYTGGKFVKDGVFDPSAVSKQCGAAVLLKRLIERRDVARPA